MIAATWNLAVRGDGGLVSTATAWLSLLNAALLGVAIAAGLRLSAVLAPAAPRHDASYRP